MSRQQAADLISSGAVLVGGSVADKASRQVDPAEPIVVTGPPPRYVSRGGHKLEAALDRFEIPMRGRRALDAGASTGGFTDCLLQRGAAEVVAVDVGFGQLHERMRRDGRVVVLERTNVRHLTLADVGGRPFDVVVADLSFISLAVVAPILFDALAAPDADAVALVKPQFEAGRAEAGRGHGVIRDPVVWRRVLGEVRSATSAQGAAMIGVMVSPLKGAEGNVEFLAHIRPHQAGGAVADRAFDEVVAEAAEQQSWPA